MSSLGRLEAVNPREVWPDEARDFTPWLLENADLLEEALGIEVELESAEHPVGGFSLDLIGRDLTNNAVLIVENQLAASDHGHLGQILTYAAGTDAATIVWVATEFRPEHRQAIDWFNERTGEDTRMFGLQVGVRRIGSSDPAPLLDVVSQPNNWQKQVRAATRATQLTGRGKLYFEFWTRFLEVLKSRHPEWTRAQPVTYNSLSMSSGIRGASLSPLFAYDNRLGHHLWIDAGDPVRNKEIFDRLFEQKESFEGAYGRELVWDYVEDRQSCKIADYADGGAIEDTDHYDDFIEWFIDAGERWRRAAGAVDLPV